MLGLILLGRLIVDGFGVVGWYGFLFGVVGGGDYDLGLDVCLVVCA